MKTDEMPDTKPLQERTMNDALEAYKRIFDRIENRDEQMLMDLQILRQALSAPSVDVEIPQEYKISDEEIDKVWGNANFGDRNKREIILQALLQIAGGFATGYTAMCICRELKLLTPKSTSRDARLTAKGKRVMYYWNKSAKANTPPAPIDVEALIRAIEDKAKYHDEEWRKCSDTTDMERHINQENGLQQALKIIKRMTTNNTMR